MDIFKIAEETFDKYSLIIHYRNPYLYSAGSENYIVSQIEVLSTEKIKSVIIFPIYKSIWIGKIELSIRAWGVIYEKKFYDGVSFNDLLKLINRLNVRKQCVGIMIHSIIFMKLEELSLIVSSGNKVFLYLHDFCTACPQYNLLKNGTDFCGNAKIYKEKCHDCKFYNQALDLHKNVIEFLDSIEDITVVSPSNYVKDLWKEAFPKMEKKILVMGHKILCGKYEENNTPIKSNEKIKVAFVGKGVVRKGYYEWLDVVDKINCNDDLKKKYDFYHFGFSKETRDYIKNVTVSVIENGPDAMIKAIRQNSIDVVVLFSCVPETYSYTYFESIAANCFVITSSLSGNIATEVTHRENGIVIDYSSESLLKLLSDYKNFKTNLNQYKKSSFNAPKTLKNNTEYVNLLMSKETKEIEINMKENRLSAVIANILYRIRYKLM